MRCETSKRFHFSYSPMTQTTLVPRSHALTWRSFLLFSNDFGSFKSIKQEIYNYWMSFEEEPKKQYLSFALIKWVFNFAQKPVNNNNRNSKASIYGPIILFDNQIIKKKKKKLNSGIGLSASPSSCWRTRKGTC